MLHKNAKEKAERDKPKSSDLPPNSPNSPNCSEIAPQTQTQTQANKKNPPNPPRGVREVFEYWQERTGHSQARLGDKRRKAIAKALKLYTVEELKEAVDGCVKSRWHQGDNERGKKFDDIELIVRDEKHVDDFRRTAASAGKSSFRMLGDTE